MKHEKGNLALSLILCMAASAFAQSENNPAAEIFGGAFDFAQRRRRTELFSVRRLAGSSQFHQRGLRMRAYVVITTEPGKSREIARQIASLPGVKMADACWGSRDVFAVIEVRSSQELNQLVMDKIQRLEGVRETNTHIAIE